MTTQNHHRDPPHPEQRPRRTHRCHKDAQAHPARNHCGRGPSPKKLEEQAQGAPVTFLGYRKDIPHILAQHTLLVHCSPREGTPYVIYEALAAGLPVIATPVGGVADQITHGTNGLLITPHQLTETLRSLSQDITFLRHLTRGARTHHRPISIQTMAEHTNQIYRRYGQP
ncbi:MAG: glycosyltransferase family 4 protein [Nitrosarchaeum sp.]|nr:glycosyltransferase family 4 protein [Nitrosarchaeum sp.]